MRDVSIKLSVEVDLRQERVDLGIDGKPEVVRHEVYLCSDALSCALDDALSRFTWIAAHKITPTIAVATSRTVETYDLTGLPVRASATKE